MFHVLMLSATLAAAGQPRCEQEVVLALATILVITARDTLLSSRRVARAQRLAELVGGLVVPPPAHLSTLWSR